MTDTIFTVAFNVMGIIILFLYLYATYSKKGWKRFERFSGYVHFLFPVIGIFLSIVIFAFLVSLDVFFQVLFSLFELILIIGAYALNTSPWNKMNRKFTPTEDHLLANHFPYCEPDCDDHVKMWRSKNEPSSIDPMLYFKEHYDTLLEFDPDMPDRVINRYYKKIHPELADELKQPPKFQLSEAERQPKKKHTKKNFEEEVTESLIKQFVKDQNSTPSESLQEAYDKVREQIEQQQTEEAASEVAEKKAEGIEAKEDELSYAEEKARFLDILQKAFEGCTMFIRYTFYFWSVEPEDMPYDRAGNKTELSSYVKYLLLTDLKELPYELILDNRVLRPIKEFDIEFTRIFALLGEPHSEHATKKLGLVKNLEILDAIRNFEEVEEIEQDARYYETKSYRLGRKVDEMRLNSETLEQSIQGSNRKNKRSPWFSPEHLPHKKHWYNRG